MPRKSEGVIKIYDQITPTERLEVTGFGNSEGEIMHCEGRY